MRVCDSCALKEDTVKAQLAPSRPTVSSAALALDILSKVQMHTPSKPGAKRNDLQSRSRVGEDAKKARAASVMEVRMAIPHSTVPRMCGVALAVPYHHPAATPTNTWVL